MPVTGNVFPSNIQGLPTWHEIRVNKDGYTARTPHFDLMVALNAATYDKDAQQCDRVGALLKRHREDASSLASDSGGR